MGRPRTIAARPPLIRKSLTAGLISVAVLLAAVVALELGATAVYAWRALRTAQHPPPLRVVAIGECNTNNMVPYLRSYLGNNY